MTPTTSSIIKNFLSMVSAVPVEDCNKYSSACSSSVSDTLQLFNKNIIISFSFFFNLLKYYNYININFIIILFKKNEE